MSEITTQKVLTPAQRKAIECLLTTGSVSKAALAAGSHRSTLYKWMQDDVFVASLREAEAEAVQSLSRSLAGLGDDASEVFRDALAKTQKITVRLRAAEIVTDRLLKLRELVDIEARLLALEVGNAK